MRIATAVVTALVIICFHHPQRATAQRSHHGGERHAVSGKAATHCYDPSDADEIRLWSGNAPGAVGNDPCRDIPFLQVFRVAGTERGNTPAILVIPGGGYDRLSDEKEQAPVAEYFSRNFHVTTFVLYYRLVQADGTYRYPVPMWDGQRAFKLIRYLAQQYGIDPKRTGVFGFSAGGHLASTLALHAATDFDLPVHDSVDAMNGRPDILGLGYPVISMDPAQFASPTSLSHLLYGYRGHELDSLEHYLSGQDNVTRNTPPVFLFESMDDQRISPQNSVMFAQALHVSNIPAGIHLFSHGVHGAGLAVGIPEEDAWPELFHRWLASQGFI
jgi:acetyl esterase/lipase